MIQMRTCPTPATSSLAAAPRLSPISGRRQRSVGQRIATVVTRAEPVKQPPITQMLVRSPWTLPCAMHHQRTLVRVEMQCCHAEMSCLSECSDSSAYDISFFFAVSVMCYLPQGCVSSHTLSSGVRPTTPPCEALAGHLPKCRHPQRNVPQCHGGAREVCASCLTLWEPSDSVCLVGMQATQSRQCHLCAHLRRI